MSNFAAPTVSKFAPGATTPTATLTGLDEPQGMAFDASGNLYVVNYGTTTVSEFAPGTTTASHTLSGLNEPAYPAFDDFGNLYVSNYGGSTISEFAPGSTTPTATLTGPANPNAMLFSTNGNLYVSNIVGSVSEFSTIATPEASSVTIQSSVESRPMLIGGTNSSPVAGINLTTAELARIYTTSTGTVTIGDSSQTGNITFSTATPATTAGATLNVIQSTTGSGQIILDDGAGTATALSGNGGSISITAGTGGIVALAASNNTAEIATTGASVTLLTSGPIGTSTNRIQFADDSNTSQQVVSVGSTSIQPGSVYLDGLGSLTLDNILGGTSNATIDITARTNLVVSAGAKINGGASTLSLGADLTAAKTGDNGVGTLSINAGATVTSSNTSSSAITLRSRTSTSTPAVTRRLSAQRGSWVARPARRIPQACMSPDALAFDPSGNLYVENLQNYSSVVEFAPGSTTASATYDVNHASALAFDSSGNLYVASDLATYAVFKFARAAPRPALPITPTSTNPWPWLSIPAATCTWPTPTTRLSSSHREAPR